ncbi:Hypothetical predicted protein [Lecanosticta acicola]|uniref:Uncharacterized protein n=1 Tax=Lecanosticta acicola TaxID=111012 RepID=A0AAI8YYM9_9PEZI|nr:Hypothetical predicted protein [Lecanosticta acicola]
MDCFHDFCLFCDRDSPDAPYCSQQCKLADLERANHSNPASPTTSPTSPTSPTSRRPWHSSSSAYKLDSLHQQTTPTYDTSSSSRPRSSYLSFTQMHDQDERLLTPSSSRTSLSSTTTSASLGCQGMSPHAKQQLQEYFSSFDQAKAAKRRSSTR